MKKNRLLEIIREEIGAVLGEGTYAGKNAIIDLKKDPSYNTLSGDGKLSAEKELKTGGTVELEEEDLNEIPDFGGKFDQQVATKYGEDKTLEDATKDITDEILKDMGVSRDDLKKDADKAKEVLKLIRSAVVGKNRDERVSLALGKQEEFDNSGNALQSNQTNNAILKALGLKEPGQRGRKSTDKPEIKKPTNSPKIKKETSIEPSDDEGPSSYDITGDETAKELTKSAPKRDRIIKAYQQIAPELKDKITSAKSGDKEAMDWLKKHTPIIKAYKKAQEVKI